MQEYEDIKTMVAEIEDDINKTEGGNKAAGTRVRKQMQQIKKAATAVRNKILEIRSSEQGKKLWYIKDERVGMIMRDY